MTTGKRVPCSDQSLARGDPMYGTASVGFRWVLLELPGAWGHSAFLQSPSVIDPTQTRDVLGLAISASLNAPIPETPRFGVFRM